MRLDETYADGNAIGQIGHPGNGGVDIKEPHKLTLYLCDRGILIGPEIAPSRANTTTKATVQPSGASQVDGLDYQRYVRLDQRFVRPAEVDLLVGEPKKAEEALGWNRS